MSALLEADVIIDGNWLSQACNEVESEFHVAISDYARQLILQTAVAFEADPHPAWADEKQKSIDDVREKITEGLKDLAKSVNRRGHKQVTFFHILHYIEWKFKGWPVAKDPAPQSTGR